VERPSRLVQERGAWAASRRRRCLDSCACWAAVVAVPIAAVAMAAVAMAAVLERRVDTHGLAVRAFLHALEHDDLCHPLHFLGRFRRTPTGDPADGTLCSDGYDTDAVGAVGRAVRVDDVEASSDVELCESEGGSGSTWVVCVSISTHGPQAPSTPSAREQRRMQ
jgi:hypothetical protein